jgi:uncharacterized protein DUF6352
LNAQRDFWLACGHHLLDRNEDGHIVLTDEFLMAYLARPEMIPPPDACAAERALFQAVLKDPRRPVAPPEIAAIADEDARENWAFMISWREHLARYPTLEAAYLAIVRQNLNFPPLLLNQLVQVILRNVLDECDDAWMLRAAEMLFRPQRLILHEGSLLAADEEIVSDDSRPLSPLDVLSETNAAMYWRRSDSFDMALDLTAGRRGQAALGDVITRWVLHMLAVEIQTHPLTELRDVLTWYVGLDVTASQIGDALWKGDELDQTTRGLVVGLYRLTFADDMDMLETARGKPAYVIVAMSRDQTLRLKPQNLIAGLPIRRHRGTVN